MVTIVALILYIFVIHSNHALTADEQLSVSFEQEYHVKGVSMRSATLPCQAILPYVEPERVMWYKLTNPGQTTISVCERLVTKDPRFSVAYYSIDHGYSPAKWDLHITNVRLSDAGQYQCHVVTKHNLKSSRSNVKLIVDDIIVDIQPNDALVSIGNRIQFTCNFTGQQKIQVEKVVWFKDEKPLVSDVFHVIKLMELSNITVATLEINVSNVNDGGSYRCSDGYEIQSKEARLYVQDTNQEAFRSLSSSAIIPSLFLSSRTVFYFLIFPFFSFYLL